MNNIVGDRAWMEWVNWKVFRWFLKYFNLNINNSVSATNLVLHYFKSTLEASFNYREGGDNELFIKLFNKLIRLLNNFWDFNWILIDWFIKLSVQTFQLLILIYRRFNFVFHHWRCTLICRPLSYPFRSLL